MLQLGGITIAIAVTAAMATHSYKLSARCVLLGTWRLAPRTSDWGLSVLCSARSDQCVALPTSKRSSP